MAHIFYPPPQPTQQPPHVPIPAQGDQPPKFTVAKMMATVNISWPTGLEYQPYQLSRKPPIPTGGDQPPKYTTTKLFGVLNSWIPPDPAPTQKPLKIAPLTLTYGQQPPPLNDAMELQNILASWPSGFEFQPFQLSRRPPIPNQGDRPPPYSIAEIMQFALASWPTGFEYAAPQLLESAATIPAIVTQVPFVRMPQAIMNSWLPPEQQLQETKKISPLTLTYGDAPPRFSIAKQMQVTLAAWPVEYPPTQLAESAATIPVTVVTFVPFTRLPSSIISSWEQATLPTRQATIAPLTLTYGQQPPIPSQAGFNVIMRTWLPPDPQPQRDQKNFAPLTLTYGSQPPRYTTAGFMGLLRSWLPPDPQPQRDPKNIAPLTLRYGDQPPKTTIVNFTTILRDWLPPDPQPQRNLGYIAPLTITYGDQPPKLKQQQPYPIQEFVPQQARKYTVQGIVAAAQVPFVKQPESILSSWQVDFSAPQPKKIAPLTLTYGQRPPIPSKAGFNVIMRTWLPPDPQPQRDRGYIAPLTLVYGQRPPIPSRAGFNGILRSWLPPDPQPQRDRGYIAPLTITYGQQPPKYSTVNLMVVLQSWNRPDLTSWQMIAALVAEHQVIPVPPVFVETEGGSESWLLANEVIKGYKKKKEEDKEKEKRKKRDHDIDITIALWELDED